MNMNKKLLALAMGIGLATSCSLYAASSVGSTPSGSIGAISSLTMADGTFTLTAGSATDGTGAAMTATDVMTITIANNNGAGYDIDVVGTYGHLLDNSITDASSAKEGLKINYSLACDGFVDESTAAIVPFTASDLSPDTSVEVYSHADPAESTVNQTPSCDLAILNDDLDEKLASTYRETFTFTITND
jgi:hypothetical protein